MGFYEKECIILCVFTVKLEMKNYFLHKTPTFYQQKIDFMSNAFARGTSKLHFSDIMWCLFKKGGFC